MLDTKTGAGLVGSASHSTEGSKMEIKAIRGFVWDGLDVKKGATLEVPEKFGRQMINQGRAELSEDKPKKKGRSKKDE